MCPAPSRTTRPPSPGHQRGAMLLIILTLMATAFAAALLGGLLRLPGIFASPVDSQTRDQLENAKAALSVWGATRDPAVAVSPGTLPYPDRNADGNYNGFSNCPGFGAGLNNNALRLGQIPFSDGAGSCKTGGGVANNSLMNSLTDTSGANLWMAVSQNLTDHSTAGSVASLSTRLLDPADALATARWISVCDEQGRLLTNRAAYAVLAPMQALGGQNRAGAPNANQFLDQITLSGIAPCNGIVRNFQNGPNLTFASLLGERNPSLNFNDRVAFVTAQQHLGAAAQTVASDLATQLRRAGFLPNRQAGLRTIPFTIAGSTLTANLHGYVNGDTLQVGNIGGALPVPLLTGQDYFVVGVAGNTLQLSATLGGPPIVLTSTGTGLNFLQGISPAQTFTANAGNDRLTANAHGYQDGFMVQVRSIGGNLPAPLATGTTYFVVGATANDLQLSTTLAGPPINLTSAGSGQNVLRGHTAWMALTASPAADTFTSPSAHQRTDGELVRLGFIAGGALPATAPPGQLATTRSFYVVNATPTSFQLSQTSGGAVINMTNTGASIYLLDTLPAYLGNPVYAANNAGWFQSMGYTRVNADVSTLTFINCVNPLTPATAAVTANAMTDTLTAAAHGYPNGYAVHMGNSGGALPAPLSPSVRYFVVNAAANTLQLAAAAGGAPINLTNNGTGQTYMYNAPGFVIEATAWANGNGMSKRSSSC